MVIKMKTKKGKKKLRWILLILFLIVCVSLGTFWAVVSYRMSLVPKMTFDEMLSYTTKDNDRAVITVGIIKDGKMTYTVYGKNASVLPEAEHTYEIGSLTKTFTASLLCKAISEGKIDLNDQIDKYINLPEKQYYPTLKRLVTHTSGYKGYYFEWQMASNFLHGQKNDFYGIDENMLVEKLGKAERKDKDYKFRYSNFGFAAVGEVLSSAYGTDYTKLMNSFITDNLKLKDTKVSDGTGDLNGYWNWKPGDAYIPAGAITSTISDMMKYLSLQMSDDIPYLSLGHEVIAKINAATKQYEKMNIRMDGAGIGWMIDMKNNIIWHNGGTSNFNSYAAFDKEKQIGVVILSNCSPNYRIPATVMGVKLMMDMQNETGNK
ncbi:serine hydrolase domain-containing protein [Anaerocolumna xylanovorans]|uniref:CubicO group peptidase, beta-lactamase class C family n=1 Tax=Anaerocolumna xylanovorans DSM 12503 TaxID=1121345 RepID=A0A1M7Y5I7_9FIRM|nr:serine hydrolase domain-containing protein [Anaerocolumna xylanovorans]SHO47678.1 CubicO group peptidase, beta-lactamase class C family [Anaerocolumna xylanovorans DSM 12503]